MKREEMLDTLHLGNPDYLSSRRRSVWSENSSQSLIDLCGEDLSHQELLQLQHVRVPSGLLLPHDLHHSSGDNPSLHFSHSVTECLT